jgi:branched-chain amino acid transport system ATP-binding protein
VPEGRKLFPQMTVLENLEMGAYLPEAMRKAKETLQEVMKFFPVIQERRKQLVGTLSGGEQQMLAIGRALMARPKLLMLDEPTLGLSPKIASEIYSILDQLHERGMSVLLISQDVLKALRIANRAYVMENGSVIMEGPGQEILRNPKVKEAYLGI